MKSRGITVLRSTEPELPQVLFHAATLRVTLFQVLRNAYDAMPRGGMLTVRMSKEEKTGNVLLTFSDTGKGFSEDALMTLFAPFASTRKGHLGLGLALVRRTMRAFGGDADAANGEKSGAVITLRFPPASDPPPAL